VKKKIVRWIRVLYLPFSLGVSLLSVLGLIAPCIAPRLFPQIQLAAAVLLPLLPFHFISLLLFWKRIRLPAILSALLIISSAWVISGDYSFRRDTLQEGEEEGIRLVSLNVKSFYQSDGVDSLISLIALQKPDIVCLQEFHNFRRDGRKRVDRYMAKQLGLPYYAVVTHPRHVQGGAIFSRYPILGIDTIYISNLDANTGFIATLDGPDGKIGIANLHLTSFQFQKTVKKDNSLAENLPLLIGRTSVVIRNHESLFKLFQVSAAAYPFPLLVAADMNSVSHSWVVSRMKQDFQDSFRIRGSGPGWTFHFRGGWGMRIDFLFASDQWEVAEFRRMPTLQTDHYLIYGKFRLTQTGFDPLP
jgi:endonuclease/exonuclease/phosphatase (EEP) superfamily protein YafD